MRDFYSVLNVAPKASEAEIKSAFRHLAKTCHPDLRPDDPEAEQVFQEVKRAYTFLANPETRRIYDTFLANRMAAERARRRRAVRSMSATFLLAAATAFLVTLGLNQSGVPIAGLIVGVIERTGVLQLARSPARAEDATAGIAPVPIQQAERAIGKAIQP